MYENMDLTVQEEARMEKEVAENQSAALAGLQAAPEPWWLEQEAESGVRAEYPAQAADAATHITEQAAYAAAPATYVTGQAAIATQHASARADLEVQALAPMAAKTVLNAPEGFRNGYLTLSDANGTILNISDNVTPSNVHLHTVQDSFIHGHATANDEIKITSATHHAVYGSLITTGGTSNYGHNSVTIRAEDWSGGPSYGSIEKYASINGHGIGMVNSSLVASGPSEITIYGEICGVYGAHSPGATSVVGSEDIDRIIINNLNGYGAMVNASLHAGGGNDVVYLNGSVNSITNSAVHLGDGDDQMEAWGRLQDSTIMSGEGNDSLWVFEHERTDWNYHYSLDNTDFLLGEGNDTLNIWGGHCGIMLNSSIVLEDYSGNAGDKRISIYEEMAWGGSEVPDDWANVRNSEINLGNGNDLIEITSSQTNLVTATVVADSYILTGAGNDTFTIGYDEYTTAKANALDNTFVDMGAGNDMVSIASHVVNSDIYGGAGNDVVAIEGNVLSSQVILGTGNDALRLSGAADGTGSTFDGGSNNAINYGLGKVGDILSLDQTWSEYLQAGAPVTLRNFESLNLDFTDSARDALNLDDLLGGIDNGTLRNCNFSSLILTGDSGAGRVCDSVYLGDDVALRGSNLSVEGMEGQTFNWYTANAGTADQLEVYIATGMLTV